MAKLVCAWPAISEWRTAAVSLASLSFSTDGEHLDATFRWHPSVGMRQRGNVLSAYSHRELWTALAIFSIPISGIAAVGNGHLTFHLHLAASPGVTTRRIPFDADGPGRFRPPVSSRPGGFGNCLLKDVGCTCASVRADIKIIRPHAAALNEGGLV